MKIKHSKQDLLSLVEMSIGHHFSKGLKQIATNFHPKQKTSEKYLFYETSDITYCKKLNEEVEKQISISMKISTIFATAP